MRIEITKGMSDDAIAVTRADGSTAVTRFPKKGPVPHDAVHFYVEKGLGLVMGFWGMVASGHHPEEIAEIAKQAGHASASRAQVPEPAIVELLQAERLVECFEAELWSPAAQHDVEAFLAVAQTACEYSYVPMPAFDHVQILGLRGDLASFARNWISAKVGHVACFDW